MSHPERFLMAGLMGWPVMHSRSPKIHNFWFAKYGLNGTYVPLAIRAEGLCAALRALPALGFAGCNLTIPHKEAAFEIVDRADPLARRIGAINCVVVAADGSLDGYNYDGFGYIQSILEAHPSWRADAGPIVVVGAGGGARAVLVSLADQGAQEIRLVNRSPERAQTVARQSDRQRAWHAAQPGATGVPSLVRRDARSHRGIARHDRGDDLSST